MAVNRLRVQTVFREDATRAVADCHDLASEVRCQAGRIVSHIPVSLDGYRCSLQISAQRFCSLLYSLPAASRSCVLAACRAADNQWLSGYDSKDVLSGKPGVLVHHPGHNPGIGLHIRGRDVSASTDKVVN